MLERDQSDGLRRVVFLIVEPLEQRADVDPLRLVGADDQRVRHRVGHDGHVPGPGRLGLPRVRAVKHVQGVGDLLGLGVLQLDEIGDLIVFGSDIELLDPLRERLDLLQRRGDEHDVFVTQVVDIRLGRVARSIHSPRQPLQSHHDVKRVRVRELEAPELDRRPGRLHLEYRDLIDDELHGLGRAADDDRVGSRYRRDLDLDRVRQRVAQRFGHVLGPGVLQRHRDNAGVLEIGLDVQLRDERVDVLELILRGRDQDRVGARLGHDADRVLAGGIHEALDGSRSLLGRGVLENVHLRAAAIIGRGIDPSHEIAKQHHLLGVGRHDQHVAVR